MGVHAAADGDGGAVDGVAAREELKKSAEIIIILQRGIFRESN